MLTEPEFEESIVEEEQETEFTVEEMEPKILT